jgi:V8-like Glu-specific endopeptidase
MKKFLPYILIFKIIVFCTSCKDYIEEEPLNLTDGLINGANSTFDARLFSIGQFMGSLTCTATYIEVPNQNMDSPAYVLTNGHCVSDFYSDNTININEPISAEVIFKNMYGIPENQQLRFSTKKIAYSTMKGTDLAIIELNHTNRELQKAGLIPLKIASKIPSNGSSIQAYGYPLSFSPIKLRKSIGVIGKPTMVAEFIWLWNNFFSAELKNISPGSSGSPVFEDLSKGIWGMINTTTIDAIGVCELGAPCEFEMGIIPSTKFETTYILDVTNIYSSFNSSGVFDLNISTNKLEKPNGLKVSLKNGVRNFGKNDLENNKLSFTSNTISSSYRIDSFESYQWENSSGFNPIHSEITEINFPNQEGFYVLTVLSNGSKNRLTFKMDFTEPAAELIRLNQNKLDNGDYRINPVFVYPELVQFKWKIGSLNSCNCFDDVDYQFYNRIPKFIYKKDLPVKICVMGFDLAANQSKIKEFTIKE